MLHAPKPLLFANSDNDTIFPMDGNRRVIERLRKGYELLGKKENVEEYVSKGGHAYRPDLRVAVFSFFEKHMKVRAPGDVGDPKARDADFPKIEGKDLRVFPEDKDLPKDQINDRVDEVFVSKAEVKLPTAGEFEEWKRALRRNLLDTSFRPASRGPHNSGEVNGGTYVFESEREFYIPVHVLRPLDTTKGRAATLIVLNPDEDPKDAAKTWEKETASDFFTEAIMPRGGGPGRWTRKNPPNTVERSLPLLGQTVDRGRVDEVLALTEHYRLHRVHFRQVRLIGRGQAGIIAAYAALTNPFVSEVIILDPPASCRDGPHFLNVDRVLDLPTALGLLAPDVKLTLVNAKDSAFDKTAAIYKLAGAVDKFERK